MLLIGALIALGIFAIFTPGAIDAKRPIVNGAAELAELQLKEAGSDVEASKTLSRSMMTSRLSRRLTQEDKPSNDLKTQIIPGTIWWMTTRE